MDLSSDRIYASEEQAMNSDNFGHDNQENVTSRSEPINDESLSQTRRASSLPKQIYIYIYVYIMKIS